MKNSEIDINMFKDVLLEQINALAEWNLENINIDTEQVRKNIVTMAGMRIFHMKQNRRQSCQN